MDSNLEPHFTVTENVPGAIPKEQTGNSVTTVWKPWSNEISRVKTKAFAEETFGIERN